MSERPRVTFERVWKKFQRGERHDSLRDLVPALVRRLGQRPKPAELEQQEFWALRDVSFEVRPGEALGIIGPNGAGKSTVLKTLTKILRPTLGACQIRGRPGALIEVAAARQASEGQQTKMEMVYQYLTGPRFRQRVQAIVEAFSSMREDLDREKKAITRQWAKREEQIDRVMQATVGMYGDLQGIAGRTLQEIEGLEFQGLLDFNEDKEEPER